jgi:hypothetical protein
MDRSSLSQPGSSNNELTRRGRQRRRQARRKIIFAAPVGCSDCFGEAYTASANAHGKLGGKASRRAHRRIGTAAGPGPASAEAASPSAAFGDANERHDEGD